MALRKAIGTVKDQTSISLAKVAGTIAPELEVKIVKATSHDDDPANERHIQDILTLTSGSRGYVKACVIAVSRRLLKTRDWVVALKALMLVHRLVNDGDFMFRDEFLYGTTRKGRRVLDMSGFNDEENLDHSAFVRTYAFYLEHRLELMLFDRKGGNGDNGIVTERIFGKMGCLQRLLDRFLACRPVGLANQSRMILIALYPIAKDSFKLYADICEVLGVLLDKFFDMEYPDCVKVFDAYSSASKQLNRVIDFYEWCKDVGVARPNEYPEVQRITTKLLETLDEFVRDKAKKPESPERKDELPLFSKEEETEPDMNEIKALPAPENSASTLPLPPEPKPKSEPEPSVQATGDLVDLRDDGVTADAQGNQLALALFAGPAKNADSSREALPSDEQSQFTSAWQNPAAESGKADWELALVESASNLSNQKAALGGGFDPLLLNGIYDQGMVNHHTSTAQVSGGSSSSVAHPGAGKSTTHILALPAPDGSVQTVNQDPFAASLNIPPPSYVQMSEMEKKQHLLIQEQQMWQQYATSGMQGQASLARMAGAGYYAPGTTPMPYGMPPTQGMGPQPGYYYPPY